MSNKFQHKLATKFLETSINEHQNYIRKRQFHTPQYGQMRNTEYICLHFWNEAITITLSNFI